MSKLIIANWKSNPQNSRQAIALARAMDYANVVIAPPYPFLEAVGGVIKKAALGAQDVFWAEGGPYTGEVSLKQLKSLGIKYVILGHSERRRYLAETDELINLKVKAALKTGFKVILCVGEPKRKNLALAKTYVRNQLKKDLKGIRKFKNLIIAYEPVWAISTSKQGGADTPEDTVVMANFIRRITKVKVIYGGSVTGKNAKSFLEHKEIEGALVGGASLNPKDFSKIIR